MDALVVALTGTGTELWFGHGSSGERMLLEHERKYGLGMDALVIALTGTRTELWFGHGCSGEPMLLTRGLIRVLEVFVSTLGETWGRKAESGPCISGACIVSSLYTRHPSSQATTGG